MVGLAILSLEVALGGCGAPPPSAQPVRESAAATPTPRKARLLAAGPGTLHVTLHLSGEISLSRERMAQVRSPAGVVKKTLVSLGQTVGPGDSLALVESRELALARLGYADAQRELEAALALANASGQASDHSSEGRALALSIARQRLLALGEPIESLSQWTHPLEKDLSLVSLSAPRMGEVVQAEASVGLRVDGEKVLFVIADRSVVQVSVEVPSAALGILRKDMEAKVSRVEPGLEGVGRLVSFSVLPEGAARTATVTLELTDKRRQWRVGAPVDVSLELPEVKVPVALPRNLLSASTPVVDVQVAEGEVERRTLELGFEDETRVEVRRGLREGELVLVREE